MLAFGIGAALASAATQAIAHAMLKAGRDKLVIRGLIGLTCAALVAPAAAFVAPPGAGLWPWLLLANGLHAIYQLVLVRAYDAADFSRAFPLARGVVPVATCALGVLLLGDRVALPAVAGVAVVSTGMALVAGRPGTWHAGLGWALAAGVLTTTYTVVDGHAVRLAPHAATFIVWFFLLDGAIMGAIALAARRGRLPALVRAEGRQGLWAGLASLVTYGLALLALRWLPVGAAAALRETGMVFALVIARYALHEAVDARRAVGASLVAAGGVLVVLGLRGG